MVDINGRTCLHEASITGARRPSLRHRRLRPFRDPLRRHERPRGRLSAPAPSGREPVREGYGELQFSGLCDLEGLCRLREGVGGGGRRTRTTEGRGEGDESDPVEFGGTGGTFGCGAVVARAWGEVVTEFEWGVSDTFRGEEGCGHLSVARPAVHARPNPDTGGLSEREGEERHEGWDS